MSSSKVVLDASAVMAVLNREVGAERLTPSLLANACCSTVNLAEVQGKLVEKGLGPDDAWDDLTAVVREVFPFNSQHARTAGSRSISSWRVARAAATNSAICRRATR